MGILKRLFGTGSETEEEMATVTVSELQIGSTEAETDTSEDNLGNEESPLASPEDIKALRDKREAEAATLEKETTERIAALEEKIRETENSTEEKRAA